MDSFETRLEKLERENRRLKGATLVVLAFVGAGLLMGSGGTSEPPEEIRTQRLVVVDEDYERCGFSAEVAAVVAEKGFHNLKAPVARVANPNVPLPFNKNLENHVLPDAEKIVRAIKNVVKWVRDHRGQS